MLAALIGVIISGINQKPEDSTFATVALGKLTGLALAVFAGAATAGFVGVAAGTVGVAAYVAGGAVTVGSLVL